ncbi:MAG: ATP synthase F1 subunit epsilon [Clostridiales Family XIII bacterium]|jgi:F-type H+-transporting ATPase subunit epsilon|nr:ATP synthase F1 subunit epsilon [Clostridiales Family XIII bacterium]
MANSFKLQIVTPDKLFYEGEVEMVIVRTLTGEEGFMAKHTWATKLLDVGRTWIREKGSQELKLASTAAGFIDVRDSVTIFTDAAEWPEEIDVARAEEHKQKAEAFLKEHKRTKEEEEEFLKAEASLKKAITRLKVSSTTGQRKH